MFIDKYTSSTAGMNKLKKIKVYLFFFFYTAPKYKLQSV